jgi:hypothetical protein
MELKSLKTRPNRLLFLILMQFEVNYCLYKFLGGNEVHINYES